jgi:hypothetical protein
MDIDPEEMTDPHYVLMRSKSCPLCRAVMKHRPVPVFMVKAVAAALKKAKTPISLGPQSAQGSDIGNDPWKGIFPSSDEEGGDDDDDDASLDDSDSDFDVHGELRSAIYSYRRRTIRRAMIRDLYNSALSEVEDEDADDASASDDEGLDNAFYIRPRWAPPTVFVNRNDFDLSEEQDPTSAFKLLQRGCTWEMVQNYDISYDHSTGMVLCLRSLDHIYASDVESEEADANADCMHRIFLGWNISLDEDDDDGEVFVTSILEDIKNSPSRWKLTPRIGMPGFMDVRKLVSADEVEDYNTTDTEVWVDSDDF